MRQAWELAVSWRGELIRAELLDGRVRVAAGGPSTGDVPLPIDDRALLLRGDEDGLELLAVGGAAWSIDGAAAGDGAVTLAQGTARLVLGDLEVAVQSTKPALRLPRFGPIVPGLLRAMVFASAYGMIGLGLTTQERRPCPCLQWAPHARTVSATQVPAPRPPAHETPRWLAHAAARDGQPNASPRPEPDRTPARPRRGVRRAAVPPADEPSAPGRFREQLAELAAASLGDEVVRIEDLDGPPQRPSGADGARPRGPSPRGGPRGQAVGSCSGTLFSALVARHGRQTAIVACSTGVELGSQTPTPRRRHEVVVHERAASPLAPEVWSWSARRH